MRPPRLRRGDAWPSPMKQGPDRLVTRYRRVRLSPRPDRKSATADRRNRNYATAERREGQMTRGPNGAGAKCRRGQTARDAQPRTAKKAPDRSRFAVRRCTDVRSCVPRALRPVRCLVRAVFGPCAVRPLRRSAVAPLPLRSLAGAPFSVQARFYRPASNASFDGVAAMRLISHSIADCGGI
jgi:hypothetical protein